MLFAPRPLSRWKLIFALLACAGVFGAGRAAFAEAVWLEGEAPSAANLPLKEEGVEHPEFLSGGHWLKIGIDAENVEKELPAGGALLRYDFHLSDAGPHAVWNRIGYEFARSPFEWRIDDGEWQSVSPEALTTDLMELSTWTEAAWLKLGEPTLSAGEHRLGIRLPKSLDEKGNARNVLYGSDALLVTSEPFFPNGKVKPGESDRDAKDDSAAKQVFRLPEPEAPARRASVQMDGLWEIARDDEQAPGEVSEPIQTLPEHLHWKAIPVPSDKNVSRPDLLMAHRLWYRTRVEVPESLKSRSFFLTFPQNSLNTTVFVNGAYCGFNKNPFARFDVDVTKAVRPGVNEVMVGIRDAWYAHAANPDDPMKLRRAFNLPVSFFSNGFQDLDYPVWNSPQSGILTTPIFTVAGSPVYVSDVFVKPSVARKSLFADVTLTNPTGRNASGSIEWQAVDDKTGAAAKTFPSQSFTVKAGQSEVVPLVGPWEDPKLWWPDSPHLYRLETLVKAGGAADRSETTFGFREWGTRGTDFTLNGVPWRIWGDLNGGATKEEWLKNYRETGQRTMRLATAGQGGPSSGWMGLSPDEALDFFDRNGVTVRRNGPLDGEAIGYAFSESDPALKKKYGTEMKKALMENWRDQMAAQIRGERNHPSIQIWTFDNEFAYINLINLLGDSPLMDEYEREMAKGAEAFRATDPTRLVMSDGGGAFKAQSLPVHGNHYVFSERDSRYPGLAYEPFPEGGGRGRWLWDMKRPRFIGEDFYANGINPADYAMWGGEANFQGKMQTRDTVALIYRMLEEGYRWAGQSAWQFWVGRDAWGEADLRRNPYYRSNAPRAVFVRQWDWTFGGGQSVKRTYGIFNDSEHPEPLAFTRNLSLYGKTVWTKTTVHRVPPGGSAKFDETMKMPPVTARQEARLTLTLSANGREVFRDVKPVSLLPDTGFAPASALKKPSAPKKPATAPHRKPRRRARFGGAARKPGALPRAMPPPAQVVRSLPLTARSLLVYDSKGRVAAYLKKKGVGFTPVPSLASLPEAGRVLVVGPDALTPEEAASTRVAAYAFPGRTVLILDQSNPLKYQGLPAEMSPVTGTVRNDFGQELAAGSGSVAFIEDPGHPAFQGLAQKDFFTWGPDGQVYRSAYTKPTRGGKSLVQCGPRLADSALAEAPVGKGLLLLSQLEIGEKLGVNPVANRLLANLIRYGASYRQEFRPVAVAAGDDSQLRKELDAMGLQYRSVDDPLAAMAAPDIQLAIVSATPDHLKALAARLDALAAFTRRGGYLVLQGLTPEGLADYNKIVGFEHMIRPFRRERVSFPPVRNPLTSGLTLGDVVMSSGERIFPWTADEYVADDEFSYIVDTDEVAPFGRWNNDFYANLTNGMTNADAWKYIVNDTSRDYVLTLPKPQEIARFTWVGNTNYNTTSRVELVFDGNEASRASFPTQPNGDPQTFDITPPRTATVIKFRHAQFTDLPGKNHLLGADNVYLYAKRPPGFYESVKPLLNVGGLIQYPRGSGGILLSNLLFKDDETVAANAVKKRTILAAILRNLKALFAGKTLIAGTDLNYAPVSIEKQANQYRNERGWFGDPKLTFAALPAGKQTFGGVPFDAYEFPTSPVPNAIMLGGPGVPNHLPEAVTGIPVNRKADALFFLQAARMDVRRDEREVKEGKRYELARYVVHYADGTTETLPLYAEIDVDDYRQKEPKALPGAQIGWRKPYEGTDLSAVAYVKQWTNPKPDALIQSLDLTYGPDRRGVPVLLALTAATAKE